MATTSNQSSVLVHIVYPQGLRDARLDGELFTWMSECGQFEKCVLGWDWERDEPIATEIYRCDSIEAVEQFVERTQRFWRFWGASSTDWRGYGYAIRAYLQGSSEPFKEITGTIGLTFPVRRRSR